MIPNLILFEKRFLFKELSSPDALEVVNKQGLSTSTDDMFLEEATKGAKTIDTKIASLDKYVDSKLANRLIKPGSVAGGAIGAGVYAGWGAESLLSGALVGTGVGVATLPALYLASRGVRWLRDTQKHDEYGLNTGIKSMEAGISLKNDTIEKAGAWNAVKKFVGAESKISIETYARIVEHDIIVDKLLSEREKLHGQKLAQRETIKQIRRGWGTRAAGWVTDKFEVNEEQKRFKKTRASLEREKGRIAKRREELEAEINKTKERFEEKTYEYSEQVEQSIDAMQSIIGQDVMEKKEWERHILLDPNDIPDSFDVNGETYDNLDEFISKYPDFDYSIRAALRSSLKESRRLLRKKQKIGRKFGAENFDKFNQKYASEYVLEKRDVASKIENLSRKVGHSVSITSVPRELTEKFRNMTAPLTGIVKSGNFDVVTLELKNRSGETFTLELPLKTKIKTEKDFSISIEASGVKKTEKFPMALLSNMGIKIEDINVDNSIEEMQKTLIPLIGEAAGYSNFELGLSQVIMDIFRKKLGFTNMNKLKKFKISKKSEAKDNGQIVLECMPDGAGNPGVEIEIPLKTTTTIDKNKKIKIRKVEAGRAITSPILEEEMTYNDFLRSNASPKVETEKKYKDFVAIRDYLANANVDNEKLEIRDLPDAIKNEIFHPVLPANIKDFDNFYIHPNDKIGSREFDIAIKDIKDLKPTDDVKVTLNGLRTPAEITIKAIDLVDFELHQT